MIRPVGGKVKQLSPDKILDIITRWKSGESQLSIAKDYKLSQFLISKFLIANNINKEEKARARGIHNKSWKGGKIIRDGYISKNSLSTQIFLYG